MHIPSCDVGTDPIPTILVFDTTGPDMDLCLLVGTDDELVLPQGTAFPASVIEVEDASRLHGELEIAREEPASSAPRTQRILMQPSPDRDAADLGHNAGGQHVATQLRAAEARQRQAELGRQFTRQCLHQGDHARGE